MNRSMQHSHPDLYNLLNGIVGMAASFFAVISTYQEQLEYWLRTSGAFVGLLIGLITLFNLLKKKKSK